ncbi:hypothetical protein V3C99_012028, partial [Haemonchus contortus]
DRNRSKALNCEEMKISFIYCDCFTTATHQGRGKVAETRGSASTRGSTATPTTTSTTTATAKAGKVSVQKVDNLPEIVCVC